MKVKWEVDDWHAGRHYEIDVDDDDLAECGTREEWDAVVENAVQDDFDRRIFWDIVSAERDFKRPEGGR